jgi:hypothetical protein
MYDAIECRCCQSTKQQGGSRSRNIAQGRDTRSEKPNDTRDPGKREKEKSRAREIPAKG